MDNATGATTTATITRLSAIHSDHLIHLICLAGSFGRPRGYGFLLAAPHIRALAPLSSSQG